MSRYHVLTKTEAPAETQIVSPDNQDITVSSSVLEEVATDVCLFPPNGSARPGSTRLEPSFFWFYISRSCGEHMAAGTFFGIRRAEPILKAGVKTLQTDRVFEDRSNGC